MGEAGVPSGKAPSGETASGKAPPRTSRSRRLGALSPLLADLLADEARAGLLLAVAAVAAVAWASADPAGYVGLWHQATGGSIGILQLPSSSVAWVDNGAMAIFFLVTGLELSRALVHGELSEPRAAALPVIAAAGGMAGAAVAYLAIAHGNGTYRGYGVPMATDIAFAVGSLGLLGRRVPPSLRLFVLALAVADDLGSLAVLVLGYSSNLQLARVGVALGCVAVCAALRRARVASIWPYLALGVLCWLALDGSGVEPALAGVVVGLSVPPESAEAGMLELRLRSVTNGLVLPAFALANAGVDLGAPLLGSGAATTVFVAIVVARVAGKALGITVAALVAVRLLRQPLGVGVSLSRLAGAGAICGVGFTVPLLVAARAFAAAPGLLGASKLALLAGSLLAFLVGAALLARRSPADRGPEGPPVREPEGPAIR